MCKYCEGRAPLIQTNLNSGHNIDVGIYEGKIIAESYYHDAYSGERISKGTAINYCPICGRPLMGRKGAAGNDK